MTATGRPNFAEVKQEIAKYLETNYGLTVDLESLPADTDLEELGLDSLTLIAIASILESKYGIVLVDENVVQIQTPRGLLDLIKEQVA